MLTRGLTPGATNLTPLAIRLASSCSNSRGRARTTGSSPISSPRPRRRSARAGGRARRCRRARARVRMTDARVREQILDERMHPLRALARVAAAARRRPPAISAPKRRSSSARKPDTAVSDWRRSCETTEAKRSSSALERSSSAVRRTDRVRSPASCSSASCRSVTSIAGEVDQRLRAVGDGRAAAEPAVGAVLAQRPRLDLPALAARRVLELLGERHHLGAVLGVDEVQVRPRVELRGRPAHRALPRRVDPAQVAVRRRPRPADPGTARTVARRGRPRRRREMVQMAVWTRLPTILPVEAPRANLRAARVRRPDAVLAVQPPEPALDRRENCGRANLRHGDNAVSQASPRDSLLDAV